MDCSYRKDETNDQMEWPDVNGDVSQRKRLGATVILSVVKCGVVSEQFEESSLARPFFCTSSRGCVR